MHCFQCSHPTVTISISARPLEATLMSSGSMLSRSALRVVYHPSEDRRTRQVIAVIGAWALSKAVATSSRREAITEASSPRESSSPNEELMKPSQRQDDWRSALN